MAYKSSKIFLNVFHISSQESIKKKGPTYYLSIHSYLDALNTTSLSSLKGNLTQLCCKYV